MATSIALRYGPTGMAAEEPSPARRLSWFYAAYFVVVGILLPFWPVWLQAQGLTAEQIAFVLAVGVIAKIVGNPVAAGIADRAGERRRPMLAFALIAVAAFALFAPVSGFFAIVLVTFLFFTAWPPVMALGESLTMLAVRARNLDYGRIRLWGSWTFIAAAVGTGAVLEGRSPEIVFFLALAAVGATAVVTALLPDVRPDTPAPQGRIPLLQVLSVPGFVLFLAAAAAVQGSHAVYYAFGTLHWRAAGYSDAVIGALWAEGVIAEILLFAAGERLIRRFGPARLLVAAGLAGVVRWTVTGLTDALPALVLMQALHAFTFGAAHLAAIHFITRTVPPGLSATAQGLYAAVVMGLALGLMMAASGPLYASFGGAAFLAMAVAAGCAALLAWPLARRDRT
ncbi:MAG: 3-phenylpropionate MFS transporter [Rhodospirillales bacterium]|nr:MAG: 3-phenylpropionate MFS transporter [Rhodospirillales bacterium]